MEIATYRDPWAYSDSTLYTTLPLVLVTNTIIIIIKKSKQRSDRHFTSSQVPNGKIADPSITAYSGTD